MRHAVAWILCLIGGLVACSEGLPGLETDEAAVSWRQAERAQAPFAVKSWKAADVPIDVERGAQAVTRAITQQKLERAADQCGRCADRACAFECIFEADLELPLDEGAVRDNCLACGRETGFLPRPTLRLRQIGEKTIELSWDAVDGATHYVVYGLQWDSTEPGSAAAASALWQTQETVLELTLEAGSSYSFQLVAWADGARKRRSQPSAPVHIDL